MSEWWRVPGEQAEAYGDRLEENVIDAVKAIPDVASALGRFGRNPIRNSAELAKRIAKVTPDDVVQFNSRLKKAVEARAKQAYEEKGGYGKLAADVLGAPAKAALIPARFARGAEEAKALAEAKRMWVGAPSAVDKSPAARAAKTTQIERDTGWFPLPVGHGPPKGLVEYFKEVPDFKWDTRNLLWRTTDGRQTSARADEFLLENETLDRVREHGLHTNPEVRFNYKDIYGNAYPKNSGAIWPDRQRIALGPIHEKGELDEVLAHELGSHYLDLASPDVMRHGPAGGQPQTAGLRHGSPEWKRAWHGYRGHEGYTGERRAFLTGQRAHLTDAEKAASPFSAEFAFVDELNRGAYDRGQLPIQYDKNVPFLNFRAANIAKAKQGVSQPALPRATRAKPTADSLERLLDQLSRP